MCETCNNLGMPGFCTNNDLLDFVYQNYGCNAILPALLNAYRYLKDVETRKTVDIFTITAEALPIVVDGKKQCSKKSCKRIFPATTEYFARNRNRPSGLDSWCKGCKAKYDKLYHIRRKYGIEPEAYYEMLECQNNMCDVPNCEEPINEKTAEVHHKQGTKIVYGLLCDRCNRIISLAKDDWRILLKTTMYQAEKEGIDIREYLKC